MFKKATGITKRIQRGKSVAVKTLYRIEGDLLTTDMCSILLICLQFIK
jgi:hypothetical protein